jgi:hypothetical protein
MLAILSVLAVLTVNDTLRLRSGHVGSIESALTPDLPSYPVTCSAATEVDRSRLPVVPGRRDRLWTCTFIYSPPATLTKTTGLLVERQDEEPLLFLDLDQSGRFSHDERFVLSRRDDVILQLPLRESPSARYPLAIRYSWKNLKPHGEPERRILLQSAFAFASGDVRTADQRPGTSTSRQPARPRF